MRKIRLGSLLRSALAAAVVVPPVAWAMVACSDDSNGPDVPPDAGDAGGGSDTGRADTGSNDDGGDAPNAGCTPGGKAVDGGECQYYVPAPCDYDGGRLTADECKSVCAKTNGVLFCGDRVVDGKRYITCNTCAIGRRPDGFQAAPPGDSSSTFGAFGAYFAAASALEAASIDAFRILGRELACHGAPRRLVRRAQRSARDEVRHTRVTRKLAAAARRSSRGGAVHASTGTRSRRVRSLEAIALENAVEGCVRETFGALVAMWQASHAGDARVATAMQRIAVDETRHAELAWSIAGWIRPRLDREMRARMDSAMAEAIDRLECELRTEPHPTLVERAGIPTAHEAARLVHIMRDRVWGTSAAALARGLDRLHE